MERSRQFHTEQNEQLFLQNHCIFPYLPLIISPTPFIPYLPSFP